MTGKPEPGPVPNTRIPLKYWTPRRIQTWIFWALAALYVVARAWHLAAICLDGDEIFSVLVARGSWIKLTVDAARDSVHPPAFYYLVKLWMSLGGDSLLWLRTLPALFSVAALAPLVLLCRELRLRRVEINCAVGVLAIHPLLIYYAQHVRMYSLLLLCAMTSLWLFARAIRAAAPRQIAWRFVALTAANIALVYSHYYGWLIVGCEGLYILFWKRGRFWPAAGSTAAAVAAFAPWLYLAGKAAIAKGGLSSNLGWIPRPSLGDVCWTLAEFMGLGDYPETWKPVVWTIFVIVLLVGAVAVVRRARRDEVRALRAAAFLAFFVAGPVLLAFAVSLLAKNSVWGQRHLIFAAAPLTVLCVLPFLRLRWRWVQVLGALLGVFWAGMAIHHVWQVDDKKTPYDTLVFRLLASEEGSTGPIEMYALDRYVHYPFFFYSGVLRTGRITGISVPLSAAQRDTLQAVAKRLRIVENTPLEDVRGTHFWVAYSSKWWFQPRTPQQILAARNCRTGAALTSRDRFHTVNAIPVWCAEPVK